MSIGSKFALVALLVPIFLILVVLAIVYSVYPNPFLLGLVAALPSANVFVWRELRSTIRERTFQVWDNDLRRIRDSAATVGFGGGYFFPRQSDELDSKLDWVSRYGKYGVLKLYPTKLVKEKLVTKMLGLGENFNFKLDQIYANSGGQLNFFYAFDHWGLRKIPADQMPRLSPSDFVKQNLFLEELDKSKKQKVTELIESWKEPFNLAKQIATILDRFSSENGIMPPKPANPFGGAYGGIP